MASGMPSRLRQIRATAPAFCSVRSNLGLLSFARSTKRRAASDCAMSSAVSACAGSGSESGGTAHTISPGAPSASWLVASILTDGQARSSSVASSAQASTTCSQLSKTISVRRAWRYSTSASVSGRPDSSRTRSAEATVWGTSAGSASVASSTNQTPSMKSDSSRAATCSERRVFPQPPGPVSVTSLDESSSPMISSVSSLRPTKLVASPGRLFEWPVIVWSGVASDSVGVVAERPTVGSGDDAWSSSSDAAGPPIVGVSSESSSSSSIGASVPLSRVEMTSGEGSIWLASLASSCSNSRPEAKRSARRLASERRTAASSAGSMSAT